VVLANGVSDETDSARSLTRSGFGRGVSEMVSIEESAQSATTKAKEARDRWFLEHPRTSANAR